MAIIVRVDRVLADRKMTLTELSRRVDITLANLSNLKTGKAKEMCIRDSDNTSRGKMYRKSPWVVAQGLEVDSLLQDAAFFHPDSYRRSWVLTRSAALRFVDSLLACLGKQKLHHRSGITPCPEGHRIRFFNQYSSTYRSVSYTHLDVYKRQSIPTSICLASSFSVRPLAGASFRFLYANSITRLKTMQNKAYIACIPLMSCV